MDVVQDNGGDQPENLNSQLPCMNGCPENEPCLDTCANNSKKVSFQFSDGDSDIKFTLYWHHAIFLWPALLAFDLPDDQCRINLDHTGISYATFSIFLNMTFANAQRDFPPSPYGLHNTETLVLTAVDEANLLTLTLDQLIDVWKCAEYFDKDDILRLITLYITQKYIHNKTISEIQCTFDMDKVIFPHFPPATQEVIEHFGASPYIFHPESNVSKDFLLEDNPASFMNSSGDITNWSGITCLSQECHMETIINKQNSI